MYYHGAFAHSSLTKDERKQYTSKRGRKSLQVKRKQENILNKMNFLDLVNKERTDLVNDRNKLEEYKEEYKKLETLYNDQIKREMFDKNFTPDPLLYSKMRDLKIKIDDINRNKITSFDLSTPSYLKQFLDDRETMRDFAANKVLKIPILKSTRLVPGSENDVSGEIHNNLYLSNASLFDLSNDHDDVESSMSCNDGEMIINNECNGLVFKKDVLFCLIVEANAFDFSFISHLNSGLIYYKENTDVDCESNTNKDIMISESVNSESVNSESLTYFQKFTDKRGNRSYIVFNNLMFYNIEHTLLSKDIMSHPDQYINPFMRQYCGSSVKIYHEKNLVSPLTVINNITYNTPHLVLKLIDMHDNCGYHVTLKAEEATSDLFEIFKIKVLVNEQGQTQNRYISDMDPFYVPEENTFGEVQFVSNMGDIMQDFYLQVCGKVMDSKVEPSTTGHFGPKVGLLRGKGKNLANKCDNCGNTNLVMDVKEGITICSNCSQIKTSNINNTSSMCVSYKHSDITTSHIGNHANNGSSISWQPVKSSGTTDKEKIRNFIKALDQEEGNEITKIPDKVIESISAYIKKMRYTEAQLSKGRKIWRNILQNTKHQAYYKHLVKIAKITTGIFLGTSFTSEERETLISDYGKLLAIFPLFAPNSRNNFYTSKLLIYTLCLKNGWENKVPQKRFMESTLNLAENEEVINKMFDHLGWNHRKSH